MSHQPIRDLDNAILKRVEENLELARRNRARREKAKPSAAVPAAETKPAKSPRTPKPRTSERLKLAQAEFEAARRVVELMGDLPPKSKGRVWRLVSEALGPTAK